MGQFCSRTSSQGDTVVTCTKEECDKEWRDAIVQLGKPDPLAGDVTSEDEKKKAQMSWVDDGAGKHTVFWKPESSDVYTLSHSDDRDIQTIAKVVASGVTYGGYSPMLMSLVEGEAFRTIGTAVKKQHSCSTKQIWREAPALLYEVMGGNPEAQPCLCSATTFRVRGVLQAWAFHEDPDHKYVLYTGRKDVLVGVRYVLKVTVPDAFPFDYTIATSNFSAHLVPRFSGSAVNWHDLCGDSGHTVDMDDKQSEATFMYKKDGIQVTKTVRLEDLSEKLEKLKQGKSHSMDQSTASDSLKELH